MTYLHHHRACNARRSGVASIVTAMMLGVTTPLLLMAQTSSPVDAGSDSDNIIYGEEFFSGHNVTTAEEILRRIPGVAAMLDDSDSGFDDQRRGFGSDGDQILINGRRLAGKSNEIISALRRIQISNVARVELLRGTSNDIDVRSDGVVVNIILKEELANTTAGSAMLAAQLNQYGAFDLDGAVNYNGELGKLSYFVGLDKVSVSQDGRGGFTRRNRDELYFYPTGEIMQVRDFRADRDMDEYTFAANSTYAFDRGDNLQLNVLVKPSSSKEEETIPFTEFAVDGAVQLSAIDLRSEIVESRLEWEIGGTYERPLGDGNNLKILSVYTYDETDDVNSRNQLTAGELTEISRNPSSVQLTEAILRSSFFKSLSSKQTLELGAEVARNSLQQTIEVFFDLDDDGIADQIDIFDPSSTVEEIRTEAFANHNWTLSDRWTASSSLVFENSQISQRGVNIDSESQFDFLKPRFDIRYTRNSADQYRLKIERTVSQLNFGNFVPRYDVRQDRFTAGNPGLRPETAWEYEISAEHRLENDQGVVAARIFYNDIQDRIESVAIDLDGDGDFDPASGNIGDAREYGAELSFSIRMTKIGVPNLLVAGRFLARDSSVTDPFTGLERKMTAPQDYLIDFSVRHDVTASNSSYGATYKLDGGEFIRSEWREYRYFERGPEITAFVEKKFGPRWTLRFDAMGLAQNKRERNRIIFADNAEIGTVRRTEYYKENRDRRYTISLTATF